jgi:RNA polymerase sigma-70 factor (ECF subfamily)
MLDSGAKNPRQRGVLFTASRQYRLELRCEEKRPSMNEATAPSGATAVAPPDFGDLALARAIRGRDRKATAELVARHADAVYSYVLRRVSPKVALADDLTQDVFLSAWQSIGAYEGRASLRAWLLGIARHKVDDYYRDTLRRWMVDESHASATASNDIHLDDAIDAKRLRARTLAALDRLREDYRALLRWRYWDQRPVAEIASELGRTEKAIERMLARARDHFRRAWEVAT